MNIVVVYIYPLNGGNGCYDNAFRFLHSYHAFPSLLPHKVVVVCNGSRLTEETQLLFSSLPDSVFMEHDNSGWDIGAFQRAAHEFPCDMMVFFGTSAYLRGPGWLERMAEAFTTHGDTLYGCMENSGVIHLGVWPHIRTTGFWMSPSLLNSYPKLIRRAEERYGFEHGRECLTSWCIANRHEPLVVTWGGEYSREDWGRIPGGFHRDNQGGLLTGDRLSGPPFYHCM